MGPIQIMPFFKLVFIGFTTLACHSATANDGPLERQGLHDLLLTSDFSLHQSRRSASQLRVRFKGDQLCFTFSPQVLERNIIACAVMQETPLFTIL